MLYRLTLFFFLFLLLAGWTAGNSAWAAGGGTFTDTRFQGDYSTENLDAIIEEYELYDGWYWTTPMRVYQDFHGQEGKKGWTQTSMERFDPFYYTWGWFGCRWNWDELDISPNKYGWGECFGFCQFLGYLLSGQRNPHRDWVTFQSVREAGGLKTGDILRVEYTDEQGDHFHSAMVYSVDNENGRVTFLQVSGSNYNRIYIRRGFNGAGLAGTTKLSAIAVLPGLRVLRSADNLDGAEKPKRYNWTLVLYGEDQKDFSNLTVVPIN